MNHRACVGCGRPHGRPARFHPVCASCDRENQIVVLFLAHALRPAEPALADLLVRMVDARMVRDPLKIAA